MIKQSTWYCYHQLKQMKQMPLKHFQDSQPQTVNQALTNLLTDNPLPTAITAMKTIHFYQTANPTLPYTSSA